MYHVNCEDLYRTKKDIRTTHVQTVFAKSSAKGDIIVVEKRLRTHGNLTDGEEDPIASTALGENDIIRDIFLVVQ